MKNFFIKLLLVFPFLAFSQQFLNVEYNETYNTDFPNTREALLQIQEDKSIYISKLSTKKDLISEEQASQNMADLLKIDNSPEQRGVIQNPNKKDKLYFNNLKTKEFSFTAKVGGKEFYITDDFILNWQITNETKAIANYKTYKAITKFRGRTWEAWFAPELAYSYGPWKLHGLPGLILEAFDESKKYNYVATKIFQNNEVINFDTKGLSKVTFKKFIEREREFYDNLFSRSPDSGYKKTFIKSEVKPQEFDFEWETPTN